MIDLTEVSEEELLEQTGLTMEEHQVITIITKLKLFHGYEIPELEKEVNEWLENRPGLVLIRGRQVFYQMDAGIATFGVAVWYDHTIYDDDHEKTA